jgi:hypothetical protein
MISTAWGLAQQVPLANHGGVHVAALNDSAVHMPVLNDSGVHMSTSNNGQNASGSHWVYEGGG